MTTPTDTVIRTTSLTRNFGELVAVDHISLEVAKGELFGFLGPNGAGKTTLLKLLTGQLEPTSGSSEVLGLDPEKDPIGVKAKVGIVPEIEQPPSFLTAKEYLHYIGLIRRIEDIEKRANHWLSFLEMEEFQDVLCKDMSKGTKQRVMLSSAFVHEPSLLFLDEPFIGLDPYYQKKVREYLQEYLKSGGTVFMCTHILELAEKMCTRLAIINRGKIVAMGTMDELRREGEGLDSAFLRHTGRSLERMDEQDDPAWHDEGNSDQN